MESGIIIGISFFIGLFSRELINHNKSENNDDSHYIICNRNNIIKLQFQIPINPDYESLNNPESPLYFGNYLKDEKCYSINL
jgi:hypothetical protein